MGSGRGGELKSVIRKNNGMRNGGVRTGAVRGRESMGGWVGGRGAGEKCEARREVWEESELGGWEERGVGGGGGGGGC